MQKLIKNLFFLTVGLLALQACKKDEDANTNPETVVGIWTINALDPDISINGVDITTIPPELLGLNETESIILQLLLSPNSSTLFEGFQIQFNEDNTLAIVSEQATEESANYVFSDNQLIINQEGMEEALIFTVSNLSSNTMDLTLDQVILLDLDDDGIEENLRAQILINLSK